MMLLSPCTGSEDYIEVLNREVRFTSSDIEQTVSVFLVNNSLTETTEFFSAQLLSFGREVVLASGRDTARIEIIDDDGKDKLTR